MRSACCSAGADVKIAVCIVAFRNVGDVQRCIAALAAQTHTDLSVTICENGGGAAFATLREALPRTLPRGGAVRIVDAGGNLGYAGGFNVCVRATLDADAWWLVNPDAEPEPEALERMVAVLAAGEADAVGGSLCLSAGGCRGMAGIFAHGWRGRNRSGTAPPSNSDLTARSSRPA